MVRAILEGRKTMTRRIVKSYLLDGEHPFLPTGDMVVISHTNHPRKGQFGALVKRDGFGDVIKFPFGEIGDRLWVREKHARMPEGWCQPHYMADGPLPTISDRHDAGLLRVYPSIHMPRWASRITLEITGVRVERLLDISEQDAKAEGAIPSVYSWPDGSSSASAMDCNGLHRNGFRNIWASINGFESWNDNPWCWVISFKRI